MFAVQLVTVYAVVFVGTGILVRFLLSSRNMYRKQTTLIVGAIGLSVAGGVLFEVGGVSIHPGLNLNSVFYSVEVLLIALALFRYEFLNIEPLAPDVVLENMNDPVVVLDDSDSIVAANPAAHAISGIDDLVGVSAEDVFPGVLAVVGTDEPYEFTRSDSDAPATYDVSAAPVNDHYDRDRGCVLVLRDISVQERRERTLERLQSVSQRFLTAADEEAVLDIAVTAANDLLEYSYSGAMLYDETEGVLRLAATTDTLADAFSDADGYAGSVVEPGDSDVWKVFESGEPMRGDPLEFGVDATPPVDLGGSLLYPLGDHGVLGISAGPNHDGFSEDDRRFTEILASTTENALDKVVKQRELRESRELLAARNEQIEFFNGVLRHDLLNGMQVAQGHLRALGEGVDDDGAAHVAVIEEYMDDIVSLTRNVRAVTNAVEDAGADLEAVDLGAVLAAKTRKIRDGHGDVDIDVAVDLGALPFVRADDFLPEVFENLLTNAIEHNDSTPVEITVDATVGDDVVTVRIADNGPGIEDSKKEAVFEDAVTSSDSGSIGFGLYFVNVMLDRYGGDVWFEDVTDWTPPSGRSSEPYASGAVAVIELPLAGVAAEASASDSSPTD